MSSSNVLMGNLVASNVKTSNFNTNKWLQTGDDIDGEAIGDNSGYSVSISADGTVVAIGAIGVDTNRGNVRVHKWSGTAWVQLGVDISGEAIGDNSGWSVSLSADGTIVAIGAIGNGGGIGHVRVYKWSGVAVWTLIGDAIPGEAGGDESGYSVSLSADGTVVVIGAGGNDGNGGNNNGHVRVYKWSGTFWIQLGDDINGENTGDLSGWSVSLSADGTIVAIGAILNDDGGDGSGHVRVHKWSGVAWVQLGVDIPGEAIGDGSGYSVSISADGTVVAIGATGVGNDRGHVRVHKWTGTSWVQLGLDIPGEVDGDLSGYSVSISADGTVVAIGATGNDGNGDDSGHVRVHKWSGVAWVQLGVDIDGESIGDNSGWSVSISADGTVVAIGAIDNIDGGNGSGHVRVYSLGQYLTGNLHTETIKSSIAKGVVMISDTANAAGSGFVTVALLKTYVSKVNGIITTNIFVDIGAGAMVSDNTGKNVIGENGATNAYLTRVTTAVNGVVYKGEFSCIEVPLTGDPYVSLAANSGTLSEGVPGEGQHLLADNGVNLTLAKKIDLTIPPGGIADDYLYLTHGGTTVGTYTAGKFLITLYGSPDF
jgi:hypothetical protein